VSTRVLIVDDSLTVRMDLFHAFTEAGYEVLLAAGIAEAKDLLSEESVHLVVLDVMLPDGDGIDFLSELKAAPATARVPVVLLSSEDEIQHRISGLERGADEYLGKPYSAQRVLRRARELLGERAPPRLVPTILVIDDSPTFAHALGSALEASGYRVELAITGELGVSRAVELRPDAVIVDGVLPGMDGAAVVRALRLDPSTEHVPCLFLTASGGGATEVAALDAGADAFARKEHGTELIVERLAVLLRAAEGSRRAMNTVAGGPRRILLLTESQRLTEWLTRLLREDGYDVLRAQSEEEAFELLSLQAPDCMLLEPRAEPGAASRICLRLRALPLLSGTPVIVLSARGDDMKQVIDAGADDWLLSESAEPEVVRARIRALLRRRDIEERERRIHDELARRARQLERANEELRLYREIIDRMPIGALVLDWEEPGDPGSIRTVAVNPAFERGARIRASDVVGARAADAFPELLKTELPDRYVSALETGQPERLPELRWGDRVWSVQAVRLVGRKLGVLAEDVTDLLKAREERDRMERQMHAAQRLEAIGKLAGGVAHDFNNLLTVVRVYGSALRDQLPGEDPAREDVEAILAATEQATRLTSQLLAFGRRQVQELTVVSLNQTIRDLERMLRRLIGEHIELVTELAPDLGAVKADVTQMEQVIMNLVVNARDALPSGGRITIETRELTYELPHGGDGLTPVPAGRYVTVTVSDDGIGIDESTQARMFEPFFTTKERGRGTGLGLATVYGIVKQSGGTISVSSRVGEGTSVRVCLPRVDERPSLEPRARKVTEERRGTETILLVEDENLVRVATGRVLERSGYVVLPAASPREALVVAERHSGPIHALVTDVVMPEMSGRDLARRLLALRPALRVVYMSGYADDTMVHSALMDADAVFLQKPFTPDALQRTLRQVLDAEKEAKDPDSGSQ